MAHTPGPWIVKGSRIESPNAEHSVLIDDSGGCDTYTNLQESDMHLIAAAPDLLAALKIARAAFFKCMTVNGTDPEYATLACASYDAAIAKAEGR